MRRHPPGREKSATFRALLERLGRSDLIVYVDRTPTLSDRTRGDTRFVVRAGGFRFLRIRLDVNAATNATVALIGHELRHAAEADDAVLAGNHTLHELRTSRPPLAPRLEGRQVSVGE